MELLFLYIFDFKKIKNQAFVFSSDLNFIVKEDWIDDQPKGFQILKVVPLIGTYFSFNIRIFIPFMENIAFCSNLNEYVDIEMVMNFYFALYAKNQPRHLRLIFGIQKVILDFTAYAQDGCCNEESLYPTTCSI